VKLYGSGLRVRARHLLLLIIVFGLSVSVFAEGKFCGSRESDKYHYPECRYVKEIKPENLVWFKDEYDAVRQGYRPCQVCKPPSALMNTTSLTSTGYNVTTVTSNQTSITT
jgi:methylphosphotriester-DNA--protein-cysteine methyltransferase